MAREVVKFLTLFMGRVKFSNDSCDLDISERLYYDLGSPDMLTVNIQAGDVPEYTVKRRGRPPKER
jgi:hypothetical protein